MAAAKGRPRRGYATVPVLVRFPVTMLERIAAYHAQIVSQDWRLTSRHDAILLLCERGLQEVERGPAPFTPPTAVADIDDATLHLARQRGWQALRKPVQPAALRAVLLHAQG